ncbi:MAG: SWIM zinc finger family protein [Rectinemataceae bacterium]
MSYGWPRYVPAAERRAKAAKAMQRLAKKGLALKPVRIEGQKIAKTFWGKAWCANLESYSDYENRLPRGRAYVRNGSVCHLEIDAGTIRAKVAGSRLYDVTISIKALRPEEWGGIKKRSAGEIHSLLDLLSGKLSKEVMAVVTDREHGLFPKPKEIRFECSCPDWANMCKHVAAVLYGVGARLDERPELLFSLRGVRHEELVAASVKEAVESAVRGGRGRRLADGDVAEVFGVEMDSPAAVPAARPFPSVPTGAHIRELRKKLALSCKDFAVVLGVSAATVSSWEKKTGKLGLRDRTRGALKKAWDRAERQKADGKRTSPHFG